MTEETPPPSPADLPALPSTVPTAGRSLIATLLWAVGAFVLYFALQGVVMTVLLAQRSGLGFTFWVATLVSAPFGVLFVLFAARRSAPGQSVIERLGLRLPTARQTALALAAVLAFNVAYDRLTVAIGRPAVPAFMLDLYRTAHGLPGLYLAVVVAAPVFEELLFRGYLLPGLQPALGATAAALLSSAAFALPHLQYDVFDMSCVFLLGVLFATVRLKTGSTLLTCGLHAVVNLTATLQVAWVLAHPG